MRAEYNLVAINTLSAVIIEPKVCGSHITANPDESLSGKKLLKWLKVYNLHYQPRGGSVSLCGGCRAPGQGETATFIPSYITSRPDKVH